MCASLLSHSSAQGRCWEKPWSVEMVFFSSQDPKIKKMKGESANLKLNIFLFGGIFDKIMESGGLFADVFHVRAERWQQIYFQKKAVKAAIFVVAAHLDAMEAGKCGRNPDTSSFCRFWSRGSRIFMIPMYPPSNFRYIFLGLGSTTSGFCMAGL